MDRSEQQPHDSRDATIAVNGLRVAYPGGEFAMNIPDLAIAPGERVAVIGPSGCGKTTLLNLLAGILVPESGCVSVSGAPLSALGDAERRRFRITREHITHRYFFCFKWNGSGR